MEDWDGEKIIEWTGKGKIFNASHFEDASGSSFAGPILISCASIIGNCSTGCLESKMTELPRV